MSVPDLTGSTFNPKPYAESIRLSFHKSDKFFSALPGAKLKKRM
jgi:hypothetical protein